ncbi:alpha/beta hydrolase [Streptomyces indicus]|uniref:Alpha/beta hydrolase fold n=1 Tax=Streptomyces indicus TaxID=417292 RepID=A0A1G9I9E3_9ACTN|nr:alpha/beta hydrolase [Streptomyces indicus]SDL21858.1 alpha/beta hydrolase fold [Streptomyces indicus]
MHIRAIASVAALALLGSGAAAAGSGGSPGPAGEDRQPDLQRFYSQQIKWGKCTALAHAPKGLECGTVEVPLDYADPGKKTLKLATARFRSSAKNPRGSVVLNFGGPGGAGVPGLAGGEKVFGELTNAYDVVSFDPRGVGRSSPVTCGDGSDMPELESGSDAGDETALAMDMLKAQYELCRKHSGPVLAHMGTVNVSRDLDVLRAALGDKKLNYLGFSYGTRLGAVYTAQFPKKVGRMVLDGVDTLTEPLTEQALVGAEGQQTALDNFLTWCAGNTGCALGPNSREAKENIVKLVGQLDKFPAETMFGQFTGDDLVNSIGHALYNRDMWPYLSQGLLSLVLDGDPRSLMRISGALTLPAPDASAPDSSASTSLLRRDIGAYEEEVPYDNANAALVAVNCADDPDRLTADDLKDEAKLEELDAEFRQASPVFGPVRFYEVMLCAGRPKGTDYIRTIKDVDTPKFLLVGTRGDPATPYQWTTETARRLGDSAVVLDNKGEGHTGYASSKCVHRKVNDFLLHGSLPSDGSSCGADES